MTLSDSLTYPAAVQVMNTYKCLANLATANEADLRLVHRVGPVMAREIVENFWKEVDKG